MTAFEVIGKVEEMVEGMNGKFKVSKAGESVVRVQGQEKGRKGRLVIDVELFAVSSSFLMVEIKKESGDTLEFNKFCQNHLRPALVDVVWTTAAAASKSIAAFNNPPPCAAAANAFCCYTEGLQCFVPSIFVVLLQSSFNILLINIFRKLVCVPDECTFNTIIRGFLDAMDIRRALELVSIMRSKSFAADNHTFSSLMALYTNPCIRDVDKYLLKKYFEAESVEDSHSEAGA